MLQMHNRVGLVQLSGPRCVLQRMSGSRPNPPCQLPALTRLWLFHTTQLCGFRIITEGNLWL
jgi:hypothetical protein